MEPKSRKLIFVDDNPDDAFLLSRALRKDGFEHTYTYVDNLEDFKQQFLEESWDAIISDYNLINFNGQDVLDYVRKNDTIIPFILVSGIIGEDQAVELMKAGASDYIMKDNLKRLAAALRREIDEAEIKRKAQHDFQLVKQLSLIAKHTSNHVLITNGQEEIEWVNTAFEKSMGYSLEEVVGKIPGRFLQGPETDPATVEFMAEMIGKQVPFSTEIVNYTKAGKKVWLVIHIEPVYDEKGTVEKFFSIQYDITDKKNYELRLLNLNEELEEKVKQRTAALEQLNEDLKSFNYSLINHLQRPINTIIQWVDLLFKRDLSQLSPDVSSMLSEIKIQSSNASNQIKELLTYSLAAQKVVKKSKCDMQLMLSVVLKEPHFKDALEKVELIVDDNLQPCFADNNMVYHILQKILSNAIKFSSKRESPIIKIKSTVKDGMVIYSVEDNGVGFDMKYHDLLFKTFSRLHSGSSFEGAGIGLSTAKRFVEMNGGKIWAEGKVDEGATFYFSMPTLEEPNTI